MLSFELDGLLIFLFLLFLDMGHQLPFINNAVHSLGELVTWVLEQHEAKCDDIWL